MGGQAFLERPGRDMFESQILGQNAGFQKLHLPPRPSIELFKLDIGSGLLDAVDEVGCAEKIEREEAKDRHKRASKLKGSFPAVKRHSNDIETPSAG